MKCFIVYFGRGLAASLAIAATLACSSGGGSDSEGETNGENNNAEVSTAVFDASAYDSSGVSSDDIVGTWMVVSSGQYSSSFDLGPGGVTEDSFDFTTRGTFTLYRTTTGVLQFRKCGETNATIVEEASALHIVYSNQPTEVWSIANNMRMESDLSYETIYDIGQSQLTGSAVAIKISDSTLANLGTLTVGGVNYSISCFIQTEGEGYSSDAGSDLMDSSSHKVIGLGTDNGYLDIIERTATGGLTPDGLGGTIISILGELDNTFYQYSTLSDGLGVEHTIEVNDAKNLSGSFSSSLEGNTGTGSYTLSF